MDSPSDVLRCPTTGEVCQYFKACLAQRSLLEDGEFRPDSEDMDNIPEGVRIILEDDFCLTLLVDKLWLLAGSEADADTKDVARELADSLIETRSDSPS